MYKVLVQLKFPPTNSKIPQLFPDIPGISKFSGFLGFPEKLPFYQRFSVQYISAF